MRTRSQIHRRQRRAKAEPLVWTLAAWLVCSSQPLFGQSTTLINNLNVPWSEPGAGNVVAVLPGTGYGVGFANGATPYVLNSVKLEFVGTSLPTTGFGVHFYSFVPGLGVPGTNVPVNPDGGLGNPAVSPQQTLWPGQTTYITFTPTSPIIIAPNSDYMIGATEDANGNDANGLLFAPNASAYTVAGGVQMFAPPGVPFVAQWSFSQSSGAWSVQSFPNNGLLKIELDASPAPEPSGWALFLMGSAAYACACRNRPRYAASGLFRG